MDNTREMAPAALVEWLIREMEARNWKQADLARRAGMSDSIVSRVLNNQFAPGPDTCRALAIGLDVSPEFVFRLAGILPPIPEEDAVTVDLVNLVRRLDVEVRKEVLRYARYQAQLAGSRRTNGHAHPTAQ